jgi:hypothetical protein
MLEDTCIINAKEGMDMSAEHTNAPAAKLRHSCGSWGSRRTLRFVALRRFTVPLNGKGWRPMLPDCISANGSDQEISLELGARVAST